ncbi:TetR/AcrR family transcriptional regulator [Nitratireductor sp. GCM10026969]|uniref:TetR/AcrR family transcriptional regulator n=1 Tax=Nitratireductor sp. GCM10026969 TaxID=3252645 RepID=UPI0036213EE9
MEFGNAPDSLPTRGHAAKRRSIIDAAAAVFCREGFAGANIDLVAAEAGVSRQTVYNHHGDKERLFAAVVQEMTERSNAHAFDVLSTFPDDPADVESELTAFAVRLSASLMCRGEGSFLRKLVEAEGDRHPELFEVWRHEGPGRIWSALAARFARLAYAGHLDIEDPDLAARQFLALVNVDLKLPLLFREPVSEETLQANAARAVRTFLRAYGRDRGPPPPAREA